MIGFKNGRELRRERVISVAPKDYLNFLLSTVLFSPLPCFIFPCLFPVSLSMATHVCWGHTHSHSLGFCLYAWAAMVTKLVICHQLVMACSIPCSTSLLISTFCMCFFTMCVQYNVLRSLGHCMCTCMCTCVCMCMIGTDQY